MNHHGRRLVAYTIHALEKYNEGKIDKFGLMDVLSGHRGEIEVPGIRKATKTLVHEIDHALGTRDEAEAVAFICEKIDCLKCFASLRNLEPEHFLE